VASGVHKEGRELRFEHGDRVRLVVASCLTAAALPVLLREGKEQHVNQPTVAAVAPGGQALASPLDSTASAPATIAPGKAPAAPSSAPTTVAPTSSTDDAASFLVGSPTTPAPGTSITIAVPAPDSPTTRTGTASYRRWPAGSAKAPNPCATWFLNVGTTVTVTNLDNGHAVTCTIVERTGTDKAQAIVLDTPLFTQLADVVQAPIPVRMTWK
jgi:hypothetical protein